MPSWLLTITTASIRARLCSALMTRLAAKTGVPVGIHAVEVMVATDNPGAPKIPKSYASGSALTFEVKGGRQRLRHRCLHEVAATAGHGVSWPRTPS